MEQKLETLKKENSQQADEYFKFVKDSVEDESYFKDALNWYFSRYVTPICDRTLLIFGSLIAGFVCFVLIQMIKNTFPLVEERPIFIKAKDQSLYFPNLISLRPNKNQKGYDSELKNVDDAVAKYLISKYVENREGYDFRTAEIEDVNKKFNHVKNLSSIDEYRKFQLLMSKDNPDSPIYRFGKNSFKSIKIESVNFIRKAPQNFAEKAKNFVETTVPSEVEVRFLATTKTISDDGQELKNEEKYLVKMHFYFAGINRDKKQNSLSFIVDDYSLFKVK